jgi:MATE family multidrug resistance protein
MSPVRVELRRLAALALPVAAAQVGTMLLGVVDTLMLGRFSIEALSAGSLANAWVWGTLPLATGILFGIDRVVAQAHGAGDDARAAFALQRGLVLALLLGLPLAGLWAGTEEFLLATGRAPALAAAAERHALLQIPSTPFFLGFGVLRQFLQCREIVRPTLWVILGANLAGNWALIFGHLGLPRLGLDGAAARHRPVSDLVPGGTGGAGLALRSAGGSLAAVVAAGARAARTRRDPAHRPAGGRAGLARGVGLLGGGAAGRAARRRAARRARDRARHGVALVHDAAPPRARGGDARGQPDRRAPAR